MLYPAGTEAGGFWSVGNIHGASGNSLKIRLSGSKQGTWADYAADEGDPAGKGDMLKLVMLTVAEQPTYAAAIQWAKGWLGIESMNGDQLEAHRRRAEAAQRRAEQRRAGEREDKRRQAEGLWLNAAKPLGTPALAYLQGRGIDFGAIGHVPGAIRFRPDVWQAELHRKVPAMCTAFWSIEGQFAAVHLTYLDRLPDGRWTKLQGVESAKKIRSPAYWGAHIPIAKGAQRCPLKDIAPGTPVYVSEGIEDGLTVAMAKPDARIVAAGTLGNIGAMILPPQAGDIIIIGQQDAPGSKADESLEAQVTKQQARGRQDGSNRRVRFLWPDPAFKDFNDQLLGKRIEPKG
ncbi:DUF7146 domain-containing protein [Novosphingobium huizhouense]|uniref:DUF7146 domain-containing protein n=1 Tax=Novosphingobium huizhouense TaxID=2866625 RepID=UPI001CD84DBA|nr:toprim domain-containing protein [Novosphingobium huizhouense]